MQTAVRYGCNQQCEMVESRDYDVKANYLVKESSRISIVGHINIFNICAMTICKYLNFDLERVKYNVLWVVNREN